MKTYLGNATVFEPERYLRERNRKKRLLLREARPLEYENGREIDADEHSEFLSGLMFREEFTREMESLEPQERALVEALIDAEGNLSRAARSIPAITSSFTPFALAPGVLNTTIPFSAQRSRGILLTPAPALATTFRFSGSSISCIDALLTKIASAASAASVF